MAWRPISGTVPQYTVSGEQASGYVLKFYEVGTTTPLTVASTSAGTPTTTDFLCNAQGFTTLSAAIVIPHVQTAYKVILYLNQVDADANATGSAVFSEDNVNIGSLPAATIVVNTAVLLAAVDVTEFQAAYMQGSTSIADGYQSRFYYDSTSTATQNSTTVITPDSVGAGAGRWLSLKELNKNITFHQALGTVDAITITSAPTLIALETDRVYVVQNTAGKSTSTTATFQVDSTAFKTLKRNGGGALLVGDTGAVGYIMKIKLLEDESAYILLNPAVTTKLNTYYLTANQTFTPHPLTHYLDFTVVAAGGGGGGVDGTGGTEQAISAAGAGGGAVFKTTGTIDESYAIVVGTGGAGGAGASGVTGNTGGTSSVISTSLNLVALGGTGGAGAIAASPAPAVDGSSGGVASGGDINNNGGDSGAAVSTSGFSVDTFSQSGSSIFGGSIHGRSSNSAGLGSFAYGSGGGAAYVDNVTSNYDGGGGSAGIVIIKEYLV